MAKVWREACESRDVDVMDVVVEFTRERGKTGPREGRNAGIRAWWVIASEKRIFTLSVIRQRYKPSDPSSPYSSAQTLVVFDPLITLISIPVLTFCNRAL